MKVAMTLTSVVVGVLILSGCQSIEENSKAENDGDVVLEFMSVKGENRETYRRLINLFEEAHPNIQVQLVTPPEAETTLRMNLTKNNVPDVIGFNGNPTYGEIASAGVLQDLSDTDLVDQVEPAYIDMLGRLAGSDVDGIYGIPYAANANVGIYNKEKLNQLDIKPPETWPELISALEVAKEAGEVPIQFTLLDPWTSLPAWNALTANLVPENFGELKDNQETSFLETHIEPSEKLTELFTYGSSDNFGRGYDDGNRLFAGGDGVFYFQINSAIPEIMRINPDIELGVFPLPANDQPESTRLVSGVDVALSISKDTEHLNEALTFIEFMLSSEAAEQYIDEQEAFSAVQGVNQESAIYEGINPFFEQGRIISFQDHYYPTGLQSENIIQDYLYNQNEEAFLNELDKEWDKIQRRQNP